MSKKLIADIYPLSPTQEGMLYHFLSGASSEQYIEQTCFTVQGKLNVEELEAAWNKLIQKYEVLRTIFKWEGVERPLQIVLYNRPIKLKIVDLQTTSNPEERLAEIKLSDRQEGFDLARGPLTRVTVCYLPNNTYAIIWSFHHIIMDGWSVGVIWKELFQIYLKTSNPNKTTTGLTYREYIHFLESLDKEAIGQYWHKYLQGFTAPTSLPTDPISTTFNHVTEVQVNLSEELTEHLNNLAKTNHVTVSMILQAAWGILLQKYNRTNDVVFGITVSGRPPHLPGVQDSVGLFINTIPTRVKTCAKMKVIDLLHQLLNESFQRNRNEYFALTEIKAQSEIKGQTPLFDNIIVYENYPLDENLKSLNLGLKIINSSSHEMTNYNLTITAIMHTTLKLIFNYNPSCYTASSMKRIISHLHNLLQAFAENPTCSIGDLEMLSPEEKQTILAQSTGPIIAYSAKKGLHQLIEEQVKRTPDAIALISGAEQLTYQQLNEDATRLALHLKTIEITKDSLVGIMLERSPKMLICMLAILKSGGAYLPVDPNFPTERIRYMLEDSEAKALIVEPEYQKIIPAEYRGTILTTDCFTKLQQLFPNPEEKCLYQPESTTDNSLAYVIYTSGSTGQPKGIDIEHRSVVNFITSLQQQISFIQGKRFLALTTISFDISVLELFLTLASGLTVVIASSTAQRDPVELNELIEREKIEMIQMTPSTMQMLINSDFPTCQQLTDILLGGEPLPDKVLHWLQHHTQAHIFNLYGPTETTIWSTLKEITADAEITLGKPIANTQVYILDQHQHLLSEGLIGEVFIAGDGVARGYHNRPSLTKERFLNNPFGSGRMYKTGDLARRLPNGYLEYHGRADEQVKIRGFRIEAGEIEAKLNAHPQIQESAVVTRKDAAGDWSLIGYLVPNRTVSANTEENISAKLLRQYLASTLPEYMIPSTFVIQEKLPLTPNGKIDRNALPDPIAQVKDQQEYVAPRDECESIIKAIWVDVLGQKNISIFDNFFELGGHSLKITRVLSRIQKIFEIRIPLQSFFANPTIAGLADAINHSSSKLHKQIPSLPKQSYYPVSHSQRRLWILDRFEHDLAAYNMPSAFLLKGRFHQHALEKALQTMVIRHETLRTSFTIVNGEPVQIIADQYELLIDYTDLTSEEYQFTNKEDLHKLVSAEIDKPFDLTQPGLFRIHLFKLAKETHLLLITMHHIISDEWSTHLFASELIQLYEAYTQNTNTTPLAPLQIQYRDYAAFQKNSLQSERMQEMEQYWQKTLTGNIPILHLPTDLPRPKVKSFHGDTHDFVLDQYISKELIQLSQREGTTLFMTLLTTFYILLYRYSGDHDLIVGVPIAGRQDAELENLIGLFVNSLPLRLQLTGEETFIELLHKVREIAVKGLAHQDYPFDQLVNLLTLHRDTSRSPIFDTMFNLIHISPASSDQINHPHQVVHHSLEGTIIQTVEGLSFEPFKHHSKTSKFDLTLNFHVIGEEIKGTFEYCTDLFLPDTITRLCKHYQNLLYAIVKNTKERVGEIDFLNQAEKEQMLKGFALSELEVPPTLLEQLLLTQNNPNLKENPLPQVHENIIEDLRLYVFDQRLQSVPYGVLGEIYLRKEVSFTLAPKVSKERVNNPVKQNIISTKWQTTFTGTNFLQNTGMYGRIMVNGSLEIIEQVTEEAKQTNTLKSSEPRTELEYKLIEIWREILNVESVGIEDSFFTLGGNSLTIIQLYDRIKTIVKTPFSIANLFSYHTIAMFVEFLNKEEETMAAEKEIAVNKAASNNELDDLIAKLANGELSPEKAAELFTGGR